VSGATALWYDTPAAAEMAFWKTLGELPCCDGNGSPTGERFGDLVIPGGGGDTWIRFASDYLRSRDAAEAIQP
jgi:hypothetical protein